MRYVTPDDFGEPETAFNICTFWFIEALQLSGRTAEARSTCSTRCCPTAPTPGLLSEDISLHDGRLWGNYPQTYSLVGLINCATLLSKPWTSVQMSELVVVSNRVDQSGGQGNERHRRTGHGPGRGPSGIRRRLVRLERQDHRPNSPARCIRSTRAEGVTVATVDLEEVDVQEYYNGYANKTLWPLFHYRIDLAAFDRSFGEGYERVNRRSCGNGSAR